jgi:hypothetical protein
MLQAFLRRGLCLGGFERYEKFKLLRWFNGLKVGIIFSSKLSQNKKLRALESLCLCVKKNAASISTSRLIYSIKNFHQYKIQPLPLRPIKYNF